MGNETQPEGCNKWGGRIVTKRQDRFINAVSQSNVAVLIDCLTMGIDPNIEISTGNVALHIAAEKCDFPILQILLSRRDIIIDKKNDVGITPLMEACIAIILPSNDCDGSLSMAVCKMPMQESVKLFLKHGADPNAKTYNGHRPLHYACENKSMGIVFDLVGYGANVSDCVNAFDVTPLAISVIDRPSMPIAKYLLRKGAKMHGIKEFPLFLESVLNCNNKDQLAMIKLLIYNGMDRHQVHPITRRNCLHYVSISGYLPLGQYLVTLNMERDLFVKDATGRTPMDIALDHCNYFIFQLYKYAYIKNFKENSPKAAPSRRRVEIQK